MIEDNIVKAISYYNCFNEKDLESIAGYLHPDVTYITPMGDAVGKNAVLESVNRFLNILNSITVREKFGIDNKVMLVYDLYYGEKSEQCRTAVLIHFNNGLISRVELFYDAKPFANL